jgi:hypothetical protein
MIHIRIILNNEYDFRFLIESVMNLDVEMPD